MLLLVLCIAMVAADGVGQWVVQLAPNTDAVAFAARHHLRHVRETDFLPGFHVFEPLPSRTRSMHHLVRDAPEVRFAERQTLRAPQYKRGSQDDPLYVYQWHLHDDPWSVQVDGVPANHTGSGVVIGVVDDGLQHTHPEIAPRYAATHSYDFNGRRPDPMPLSRDNHGTAAAGVAAAAQNNGHCGRGVAPGASLAGIRVIAAPVTDMTEAEALSYHAMGNVDVFSCSWGPRDDGRHLSRPGSVTQRTMAMYAGGMRGRMGRGTVYVWASGNGRRNGDTCGFDGYAGSPYAIAVGALDHNGNRAWYSEGCAALMAVTPSSGGGGGIITSDLGGQHSAECTTHFGGTSAAAPLAAGIVALMLQERPELTWRDVKHIIAKAALPVHTEDHDWHMNAAGYRHSHGYGFGLLKVPQLIAHTKSHKLVPSPHRIWSSGIRVVQVPGGWMPLNISVPVSGTGLRFIEHVVLTCSLGHTDRGSLAIDLASPEGAVSKLAEPRQNDHGKNYPTGGWAFASVRHWGESHADGTWEIRVRDVNPATAGKNHFHGYILQIMGY